MHSFSRLLIAVLSCTCSALAAPEVKLGNTTVVGMDYTLTVGGLLTSKQEFFGGIPYAEPPLGDLRLKPTVLKTSPGGDTFNASQYGPSCLQPPSEDPPIVLDEDCLTINILRPANISADAKLPVLFWTYGGGFQAGSTPIFNASAIVALSVFRETPVVYVSFNYRTGPLGFPQGAEAARRGVLNLALRDQLTALEWVQRNIGTFGGDKTKVTVFGESAGSIMTAVQFLNPSFSNWARAAIFESGQAATPHLLPAQDREKSWTDFVGAVPGCASVAGSNNTFDCLKTANTSSILQGLVTSIAEADELFAWDPTVDGNGGFIPDLPSRLFENGSFAKLPFIAGTNLDEGTGFTPGPASPTFNYSTENLRNYIIANLTPPYVSEAEVESAADRILQLYPDIPALGSPFNTGNETFGLPTGYKRLAAIYGDVAFQSQRRLWQQTAANAGVKSFGYLFTQPNDIMPQPVLGVPHGLELFFVYGAVLALENVSNSDIELSIMMMDYWLSFATSLDPNDGKGLIKRPTWPQYTSENQVLLQLNGSNITTIPDTFRKEQIDFINQNPVTFAHKRSFL